jgi:cell division control protein 7
MKMDDIKCYFYDLFTGLKHTHALGVVHRDIKPSNFLYHSESKTGYLADFGLAQKQTELAQTRQEPFSERELDNLKVYTKQPAPGYYTNDTR